jgi:hypothetical protein
LQIKTLKKNFFPFGMGIKGCGSICRYDRNARGILLEISRIFAYTYLSSFLLICIYFVPGDFSNLVMIKFHSVDNVRFVEEFAAQLSYFFERY